MFGSLAPARRRLLIGASALVVAAIVAVVAFVVVDATTGSSAAPASNQAAAGPVVLVPGYGGSTTGLRSMAAALQARGRDTTVVTLPANGTGDLTAQARTLAADVDQVRARTGNALVDVVGYSAGGVVARIWARELGGAAQARRILSMGSPQHGTDVASLAGSLVPGACPTACQQLATDSSLLAGLNDGDETPSGPTWVSLWTTSDDLVVPPDSARLAGATNLTVQSVCASSRVNHSGLPTDPQVQAIVGDELAAGAVPALGPAQCVASS